MIDGPSVSLALPPVGWHNTVAHEPQRTTVCACENTVAMAKQPVITRKPPLSARQDPNTCTRVDVLTGALDVHEVRVGGLYETLQLVLPLLRLVGGVDEIDSESLRGCGCGIAIISKTANKTSICVWSGSVPFLQSFVGERSFFVVGVGEEGETDGVGPVGCRTEDGKVGETRMCVYTRHNLRFTSGLISLFHTPTLTQTAPSGARIDLSSGFRILCFRLGMNEKIIDYTCIRYPQKKYTQVRYSSRSVSSTYNLASVCVGCLLSDRTTPSCVVIATRVPVRVYICYSRC